MRLVCRMCYGWGILLDTKPVVPCLNPHCHEGMVMIKL